MSKSLHERVAEALAFDPNRYNPQYHGLVKLEHTRTEKLKAALVEAVKALETLKVAVNDKVSDPGATAFIARHLAAISAALGE